MQQDRSIARATLLFCLALALLQSGCSGMRSVVSAHSGNKLYAVTAASTPFYRYSPRQGQGPDKNIPRDTQLTLIRHSPGFSKVQIVGGEEGFVASDDIVPASSTLLASNTAPIKAAPISSEWRAEIPEPRSTTPEPPLPEFEPTPIALPPDLGH